MRDARDAELKRQRAEIIRLRQSQKALAAKVQTMQKLSGDRLLQTIDRLRAFEAEMRAAPAQRLNAVVTSAQSAAYGQRGSVFAKNNLILSANQLFWTSLDPILRGVGASGLSPAVTAWIGTIGAFAVGQAALASEQHTRFVSGVVTFNGKVTRMEISLRDYIGARYWPVFKRRADVLAVVSRIDPGEGGLIGTVTGGFLTIRLIDEDDDPPPVGKVSWLIDTGADVG